MAIAEKQKIYMPELYRRKLMGYAESFQELARSLEEPADLQEETADQAVLPGTDRATVLEQQRTRENRLLISSNLNEAANIIADLAEELYYCHPVKERYRRLLVHALRSESIYAEDFCYLRGTAESGEDGEREKTHSVSVTLYTDKRGGIPASKAADILSMILRRNLQLSATSPYRVEREPHNFVFMEEADFIAVTGYCKAIKENESVSGDHYSVLESEKGKLTLLLSDGTGSGEKAGAESEKVLDLMEKFLEAGYCLESAAGMVNAAMLARGQQYSHPTLDICDLNLYNGKCSFCKAGGAASFLKRGEKVEQISQESLPLGIFRTLEWNPVQRQLRDGDYLILMTDGVVDAFEQSGFENAVRQVISELKEVNPGEVAEKLLQMALYCCGGHIRDDMTILVAGIWKNAAIY